MRFFWEEVPGEADGYTAVTPDSFDADGNFRDDETHVEECEPLSEQSPYYSGGQGSKDELPMFGELHTYIWRDGYGWGCKPMLWEAVMPLNLLLGVENPWV